MPAVYAHECFGRAVAAQLDGEVAEVIRKYDASFQIGLQGPDIFFFFGAHTDNPVVRFGRAPAQCIGRAVFCKCTWRDQTEGADEQGIRVFMRFCVPLYSGQ